MIYYCTSRLTILLKHPVDDIITVGLRYIIVELGWHTYIAAVSDILLHRSVYDILS